MVKKTKSTMRFRYDPPNGLSWTQEKGEVKSLDGRWELTELRRKPHQGRLHPLDFDPGRMLGLLSRGPVEGKVKEFLTKGAGRASRSTSRAGPSRRCHGARECVCRSRSRRRRACTYVLADHLALDRAGVDQYVHEHIFALVRERCEPIVRPGDGQNHPRMCRGPAEREWSTGGGTRTLTPLGATELKSIVSPASSTTPARPEPSCLQALPRRATTEHGVRRSRLEASLRLHMRADSVCFGPRSPLLRAAGRRAADRADPRRAGAGVQALFERYQARLLAFCRGMLASSEDAEDVLQEVFVAAHKAILADNRVINARPWLYRIARNRCLNHLRKPVPEGQDSMDIHPHENGVSVAERVQKREEFRASSPTSRPAGDAAHRTAPARSTRWPTRRIAVADGYDGPSGKSLLVRARMSLADCSQGRHLTRDEVHLELAEAAEGLRKALRAGARAPAQLRALPASTAPSSGETARRWRRLLRSPPLSTLYADVMGKLGPRRRQDRRRLERAPLRRRIGRRWAATTAAGTGTAAVGAPRRRGGGGCSGGQCGAGGSAGRSAPRPRRASRA